MASQKTPKASRWGFLQQAVASVEAGLDTILAEDEQPARKTQPGVNRPAKENTSSNRPSAEISRSGTSTPANDRLQARLAKAMVQKSQSRPESPAPETITTAEAEDQTVSPRESTDHRSATELPADLEAEAFTRSTTEAPKSVPLQSDTEPHRDSEEVEDGMDPAESKPQELLAESRTGSIRPSIDNPTRTKNSLSTRPSTESTSKADPAHLHTQLEAEAARQGLQEELNQHIERIDALQAKLKYLSAESAKTAHDAATNADSGTTEKKLAEKDEKIALLMEEGTSLQKSELTLRQTIKKLRLQSTNADKTQSEMQQRAEKAERNLRMMEDRARKAEATAKRSEQKATASASAASSLEAVTKERNALSATLADIKAQLSRANARADAAESKATTEQLDRERKKTADLQDDLTSARVERELAEEKLRREVADLRAAVEREKEHTRAMETEMLGEQATLESKLESFRARAEEAAANSGEAGDAVQAKLLRQIETLQSQYAAASQNWQGIEGSLLGRITSLEKERDDVAARENDVRRKLRETTSKLKRSERDLEEAQNRLPETEKELQEAEEENQRLTRKMKQLEADLKQTQKDAEEQKVLAEKDTQRRIDEEKAKIMASVASQRTESPVASSFRKGSGLVLDVYDRPSSRRSSIFPEHPIRQQSGTSLKGLSNGGLVAETPSIVTSQDPDEYFNGIPPTPASQQGQNNSPRGLHDLVSTSTVGAGPSVQLVERMSANVRRLESEKAASRDEIARLTGQRDESRSEVVNLMREVEGKRNVAERLKVLEEEHSSLKERHQTTLELLGEKSEQVEELKADIADVKQMYRQLADTMGK
jgi:TATA element modulatory factor